MSKDVRDNRDEGKMETQVEDGYRFLITGGAGFIGSNMAEHLLEKGHFVRVFDNFLTGKRENVAPLNSFEGLFEIIESDLRDREAVSKACIGIDYVLHQGALASVPRSVEDPFTTNEINVGGTLNVLLGAKKEGVKRIVFASSSSIYGDSEVLPKVETMQPSPKSPYALHKLTGEHYLRLFYELYGLETVALRYFNVFGPRQDPKSMYAAVIPNFITALLQGERPTVYGDGEQTRDFTFVENVINANLLACSAPVAACGKAFNIACGTRYSLLQLLDTVGRAIGVEADPTFEVERPGDVRDSMADISMAEGLLSYEISTDFEEGLGETVEWYRQNLVG
jgi:nucleoside-diphosphate-sugar epimerase